MDLQVRAMAGTLDGGPVGPEAVTRCQAVGQVADGR
jgi:hypothetical protein